jgi:two-component system, cell cycle response regulator
MTQHILAIDDSPDIHQLLRVRLSNLDVEIEHAANAQEGLSKAFAQLPDLILLDVVMPDGNGFDVCRELKAHVDTAAIPVIFLTGASTVDQTVLGFDVGAVDYIQKPFDSAELKARVRSALRTKRYFDMLAQRAMIDGLTGLWNRDHFDQRLHEEIQSTLCYNRPLSLLMMDLDQFKKLNDGHGHPFGDEVLQAVGEVLLAASRTTDWPCRYGGEEFAMILRETGLEGAAILAEKVRSQIAGLKLRSKSRHVPVTVSIGVSCNELCRNPLEFNRNWLLGGADAALYEAKLAGRDQVKIAKRS